MGFRMNHATTFFANWQVSWVPSWSGYKLKHFRAWLCTLIAEMFHCAWIWFLNWSKLTEPNDVWLQLRLWADHLRRLLETICFDASTKHISVVPWFLLEFVCVTNCIVCSAFTAWFINACKCIYDFFSSYCMSTICPLLVIVLVMPRTQLMWTLCQICTLHLLIKWCKDMKRIKLYICQF
jgi:hypothetical protein